MMARKNIGFPVWGDTDDPSLVLQNSLGSAAIVSAAGITIDDGAGIDYDETGGALLTSTSALDFSTALSAAELAALEHNFTISFEIESGVLDDVDHVLQYICAAYDGSSYFALGIDPNASRFFFRTAAGGNNTFIATADRAISGSEGKGAYVRFDWVKSGTELMLYLDYFPVMKWTGGGVWAAFSSLSEFSLGAGVSGTGSLTDYRYRNLMVCTRAVALPVRYSMTNMVMMGMSYAENGDYGSANASGTGHDRSSGNYDKRTLPYIHRELGRRGYGVPAPYIRNTAVGGTYINGGANDLGAQITSFLTTMHSQFRIVMIQAGTNEVIAGTGTLASDYPNLEADYQTEITRITDNGATIILIANTVTPLEAYSVANWAALKSRVDEMNAVTDAIVAANSNCHKVDLWTAFGGHSPDSDLFTTDLIHPNNAGYRLIAEIFFQKLLSVA